MMIPEQKNPSFIYAVGTGDLELVKQMIDSVSLRHHPSILEDAVHSRSIAMVEFILGSGADPLNNKSRALAEACRQGDLEIVSLLLPLSDPTKSDNLAICNAAKEGHVKIVELIIKDGRTGFSGEFDDPLTKASMYGHTECVELILPFISDKSTISLAAMHAAESGNMEMLDMLVLKCDIKMFGMSLLSRAAKEGHVECLEYLLEKGATGYATALNNAIRNIRPDCARRLFPFVNDDKLQEMEDELLDNDDADGLNLFRRLKEEIKLKSKHGILDRQEKQRKSI